MSQRKDSKGRNLKDGESQRKDGRYVYRYTQNGKTQSIYARDLLQLREKEKDIIKAIDDGIHFAKANSTTVNDMFDIYIKTRKLKDSTRNNYVYMYENYVKESLGYKKLASIRYTDIILFYSDLIENKELKSGSVKVINAFLYPLFEMSVRDGYIRTNPTSHALSDLNRNHDKDNEERHALSFEEQTLFLTFVSNSPIYSRWTNLFTVMLGTGMRIGEVIGLTWNDCDFTNNTIKVNHTMTYRTQANGKAEYHITTPKTKASIREIPMIYQVKNALLKEKESLFKRGVKQTTVDGYTNFVFYSKFNTLYHITPVNSAINRIIKAYNDEEILKAKSEHRKEILLPHFSAHSLRHTFCARLCENDTNIKVIQNIMGHSNISVTMDVYAEVTKSKRADTMKELENKILVC